jgi:DNA-binding response OmpR family regulator
MSARDNIKILVVEDDPAMRRFIQISLEKAGYSVVTAEDGLVALQLTDQTEFDAIVADALMPNMSGYDLRRAVRETGIPFILLSGLETHDRNEGSAGLFLTKDTNLTANLFAALDAVLMPGAKSR